MARLYEWYEHLKPEERANLSDMDGMHAHYKGILMEINRERDAIRRKAVQRARNAMNKELRRQAKEKAQ